MSDLTPPSPASAYDTNLAIARAAITGLDGPSRAGLRETLSTWGGGPAQHALQLLRPDRVYSADRPAWDGRVKALTELAEAEGLPDKPELHYSIEATDRHPMNVLDGTTWYEGLRRDIFDAHQQQAAADLDTLEQQGSLDQMLEMVEYGPIGVEQRLRQMRPVYDLPGAVNGRMGDEALFGRREACKAWINDPETQGKHARWAERAQAAASAQPSAQPSAQQSSPPPGRFYGEVFQAGRRSMENALGRLSEPELERVAWQLRTFGLDHAEEGLRAPDIPAGNYGEAGIEGRKQVLGEWHSRNPMRGMEGPSGRPSRDGQTGAGQPATGAGGAGPTGTDQAVHAAMSGRPPAQIVAPGDDAPVKPDGPATAERPAHLTTAKPAHRDSPGVGG